MPQDPAPHAQAVPEDAPAGMQALPLVPIAPSWLHPDPRTRPVLMHLGILQLPFKVRQTNLAHLMQQMRELGRLRWQDALMWLSILRMSYVMHKPHDSDFPAGQGAL